MNRLRFVVAVSAVSAVLGGCDTLNWSQYRVAGVSPDTDDANRIAGVLKSVAAQEHMTPSSPKVNATQRFSAFSAHLQPPLYMHLTARHFRGDVLIDLAGRFGPRVPGFAATNAALHAELSWTFGDRLSEPQPRVE